MAAGREQRGEERLRGTADEREGRRRSVKEIQGAVEEGEGESSWVVKEGSLRIEEISETVEEGEG